MDVLAVLVLKHWGGGPACYSAQHPLEARKLERDSWDEVLTFFIKSRTMTVARRLAGKWNSV